MNIACERPPQYTCLSKSAGGRRTGRLVVSHLRAHRARTSTTWSAPSTMRRPAGSRRRRSSPRWCRPSSTRRLAPPGKHVVNLFGGHAPYKLRNGDWSVEKPHFRKRGDRRAGAARARLLESDIIAEQLLIPEDIERIVGLPQGHIFHGELSPDQLFFKRPAAHWADYRTPRARTVSLRRIGLIPGGGGLRHSRLQRRAGNPARSRQAVAHASRGVSPPA